MHGQRVDPQMTVRQVLAVSGVLNMFNDAHSKPDRPIRVIFARPTALPELIDQLRSTALRYEVNLISALFSSHRNRCLQDQVAERADLIDSFARMVIDAGLVPLSSFKSGCAIQILLLAGEHSASFFGTCRSAELFSLLLSNFESLSSTGRWHSCIHFAEIGAVVDHFYLWGCFRSLFPGLGEIPEIWQEGDESEIERIANLDVPPIAFYELLEAFFRHFFGTADSEVDSSALIGPFLDQFAGISDWLIVRYHQLIWHPTERIRELDREFASLIRAFLELPTVMPALFDAAYKLVKKFPLGGSALTETAFRYLAKYPQNLPSGAIKLIGPVVSVPEIVRNLGTVDLRRQTPRVALAAHEICISNGVTQAVLDFVRAVLEGSPESRGYVQMVAMVIWEWGRGNTGWRAEFYGTLHMEAVAINLAVAAGWPINGSEACRTFYRNVVKPYEAGAATADANTRRTHPGTERELLADADRMEQMIVEILEDFGWRDPEGRPDSALTSHCAQATL